MKEQISVELSAGDDPERRTHAAVELTSAEDLTKSPRTVARLLVECLEKEGVRYVFGLPGEETDELVFALAASAIRFVPCRHEQGAAKLFRWSLE